VHHAYLAEVAFPRSARVRSKVWQAVCSPFRNPLDAGERRMMRFAVSRTGHLIGRALSRSAGVADPPIRWRFAHDQPWFDNQVATLELDGRSASMRIEKTLPDDETELRLDTVFERSLV
jgi:hypothetical protein